MTMRLWIAAGALLFALVALLQGIHVAASPNSGALGMEPLGATAGMAASDAVMGVEPGSSAIFWTRAWGSPTTRSAMPYTRCETAS